MITPLIWTFTLDTWTELDQQPQAIAARLRRMAEVMERVPVRALGKLPTGGVVGAPFGFDEQGASEEALKDGWKCFWTVEEKKD
jgi:hypothetical protein